MCDFRSPPTKIIDIETGQSLEVPFRGNYNKETFKNEPGIYFVPASGSYYVYFDGNNVWKNRSDWGPPSSTYWLDTGGIHPSYCKYEFIFSPNISIQNNFLNIKEW